MINVRPRLLYMGVGDSAVPFYAFAHAERPHVVRDNALVTRAKMLAISP